MGLIAITAIALFMIALPSHRPLPPGTWAALTTAEDEGIECVEQAGPGSVLDAPEPSRTTNFRLRGSYECHRPVFAAGERDSFIEILLRAESRKAKKVALEVQSRLKNSSLPPVGVHVTGIDEEPRLREAVEAVYRIELASLLGAGQVRRRASRGDETPLLVIQVRRVDVEDLISSASLVTQAPKGEAQWLEL